MYLHDEHLTKLKKNVANFIDLLPNDKDRYSQAILQESGQRELCPAV
jgi:hypothetical protein